MIHLFRRRYDYESAIERIATACTSHEAYSMIYSSVYFDTLRKQWVMHFECAVREYTKKDKYFLSIRRDEKIYGADLRKVLDYALTYVGLAGAFTDPQPSTVPDGITLKVRNYIRIPNGYSKNLML